MTWALSPFLVTSLYYCDAHAYMCRERDSPWPGGGYRGMRHEGHEGREGQNRVQKAIVQSAGDGIQNLTVGGAGLQALSAQATYQNVNFVNCNLLVEVSCVVTQINKTSHPP
jgi:hypothetical protein